jgi:hypothetical protein
MRQCYICGRDSLRRQISEPLMVPICHEGECARRARELVDSHCSVRAPAGELCGTPTVRGFELRGHRVCVSHLEDEYGRSSPRATPHAQTGRNL